MDLFHCSAGTSNLSLTLWPARRHSTAHMPCKSSFRCVIHPSIHPSTRWHAIATTTNQTAPHCIRRRPHHPCHPFVDPSIRPCSRLCMPKAKPNCAVVVMVVVVLSSSSLLLLLSLSSSLLLLSLSSLSSLLVVVARQRGDKTHLQESSLHVCLDGCLRCGLCEPIIVHDAHRFSRCCRSNFQHNSLQLSHSATHTTQCASCAPPLPLASAPVRPRSCERHRRADLRWRRRRRCR